MGTGVVVVRRRVFGLVIFSFLIIGKEDEEMWISSETMAVIMFVVWIIFGWCYLSECDRWERMDDDHQDED